MLPHERMDHQRKRRKNKKKNCLIPSSEMMMMLDGPVNIRFPPPSLAHIPFVMYPFHPARPTASGRQRALHLYSLVYSTLLSSLSPPLHFLLSCHYRLDHTKSSYVVIYADLRRRVESVSPKVGRWLAGFWKNFG